MNLAAWERRVDAAIARIEGDSPSRLRTVPLDMIAAALVSADNLLPTKSDHELDTEVVALMKRNAFPVQTVMGTPLSMT